MTPSQADREAAAEIWQSVKRAFLKDAGPEYDDIGNTLALPYATRHRLAAEAAAFEKAAGVAESMQRRIAEIGDNGDAAALVSIVQMMQTAANIEDQIRKLAGEKHD